MASQQAELCPSLEIGNDVLSQLIQAGLSGTEWSLTFSVIQQLKCRGGRAVSISLREFRDLVGLDEEPIRKGLKTLRERNILVQQVPPSFTKPASWSFNEEWQSWTPSGSRRVLRQHTPPLQRYTHVPDCDCLPSVAIGNGRLRSRGRSSFSSSSFPEANPRRSFH